MIKYLLFGSALFASVTPLPATAATPAVSARQLAEVRLDHISIVKRGRGSPLVLIPGLGSPRESWDGVTQALLAKHSVYLVQVNGFGGDAPGANLNPGILKGIIADLSTYIAQEKLGRVKLAGHSMGGLAALMFARDHPAQVEKLMIVDALPYLPVLLARGGPEPTPAQVEPIAKMMRDTVSARFGKAVDPATIKGDVDALALKPESRVRMAQFAARADPRVTAQLLYEDMTTDLRPALKGLSLPITVVVPWSDTGFGKERTLAFYNRQFAGAPNINFVDIADSGHFVMLDQPKAFADALGAFSR
jgi:pimeloyl-ACP methyl ester carboxylesterase